MAELNAPDALGIREEHCSPRHHRQLPLCCTQLGLPQEIVVDYEGRLHTYDHMYAGHLGQSFA